MIITNTHDLPAPLVSAITNDPYKHVGDISVTSLAKSPRQRWLEIRHAEHIEEDASDRMWALLGQIGHSILERSDTNNHLAEERLTAEVLGWTLSGQADLLGPKMTLDDYKFTSVWAVKDEKPEWTAQLNSYAWLYEQNGFTVKRARIIAILRDWSKLRAAREPDYPQVGIVVREVPLWAPEKQEAYLADRVQFHQWAATKSDDDLPPCTDEERWAKPDTWAVKKVGNKRALRVYDNEADAIERRGGVPQLVVEHRLGDKTVRCAAYCSVAPFCNQFQQLKAVAPQAEPEVPLGA